MSDVKIAVRALVKTPGFSLVAILTIAAAIAANTALFSIFDRLVLNPVTIPQPSSLVAILNNNPQVTAPIPAVSWPRYEEIRDHAQSFASIAISAFDSFTLTGNGEPEQLNGLRASASFLPTLGIAPARGRNFTPEEDAPNGPAVCIISHELWQTRFGGRERLIGETIVLNGQPWEVVGVTPPRLSAPFGQVQVFAPRVFEVSGLTAQQVQNGSGYAQPIARLKPGVSLQQAASDLAAVSKAYGERFAARQKEVALRQSLGATRSRVIRQFLIESLTFSAIAGVLGILLAMWGLSSIQSLIASQLPPNAVLTLNWRALAFTAAVTLLSALLVGVAPALETSRTEIIGALKDGARGSSGAHGRFRSALIVVEVALSVVLLVGSTLLLISFLKLQRTPPGFESQGVAAALVNLPATRYKTNAQQADFFNQVIERLRAQPMVTDAAVAIGLPLSGFVPRSPYSVAGRAILPLPQRPIAGLSIVSEDYFRLMRIRFLTGRAFTPDDREGAPGVCIVNASLARKLFPGESAVGRALLRGRDAEVKLEIVGVIHDVKSTGLNTPGADEIYLPMRQLGRPTMTVVARTTGDPAALQAIIRSAVANVDADRAISFFATMDSNIVQSLGVQRIIASLTVVFAGVALVLAAVGLYSVLAYAVGQRTTEIGIRMAVGAQAVQVLGLVMRSGLQLVAVGLGIGLVTAGMIARVIQALLYNVQPLDPLVYGMVALLFAVVATLACLLPSFRASRIDPLLALRAG